jgi:hypothetical protein
MKRREAKYIVAAGSIGDLDAIFSGTEFEAKRIQIGTPSRQNPALGGLEGVGPFYVDDELDRALEQVQRVWGRGTISVLTLEEVEV